MACLLALLVGSPLCCCAVPLPVEQAHSSCCCCSGEGQDAKPKPKPAQKESCLCASKAPRDLPKAMLPPGPAPELALAPLQVIYVPAPVALDLDYRPNWQPGRPWHAPPSQRRALLVSRLL